VSSVSVFPCAGSRDEESELALAEALRKAGVALRVEGYFLLAINR